MPCDAAQPFRGAAQIMPILFDQFCISRSNTRSATLWARDCGRRDWPVADPAIQTTQDWEKVTYYIVLIVLMVVAMDTISGRIRARLIKGDGSGK